MSGEIEVGGMHWVRDRRDCWISGAIGAALVSEAAMLDEIERLRAAGDEMRADCDAWGVLHVLNLGMIEALRADIAAERAEVERLRADLAAVVENEQRCISAENGWRALADQLAKALRAVRADRPTAHTDAVWLGINTALETYEEARRG